MTFNNPEKYLKQWYTLHNTHQSDYSHNNGCKSQLGFIFLFAWLNLLRWQNDMENVKIAVTYDNQWHEKRCLCGWNKWREMFRWALYTYNGIGENKPEIWGWSVEVIEAASS